MKDKMKDKKKLIIIGVSVASVILVLLLIVGLVFLKKDNKPIDNKDKNNSAEKNPNHKDDTTNTDDDENEENEDPDNNANEENNKDNPRGESNLHDRLQVLMQEKGFNSYAIRVINSMIKDYQKLFTDQEIYDLFSRLRSITINPYDPSRPDLSKTTRAYNGDGNIVVNCFEGELDNDSNWDGLRFLLTHEIMHSLGEFPNTESAGFSTSIPARNRILEEGLADSIGNFVKGTLHDTKFAVSAQDEFAMYYVSDDYNVNTGSSVNHTYTLYGSFINTFKYVGCYDQIIDANMYGSFDSLKQCMKKNVNNGEYYFNELFKYMNLMSLYISYPSTFYTQQQALYWFPEQASMIQNTNLNKIIIEYSKLAAKVINSKKDSTYSICDYKKRAAIFYSDDQKTFKNDLNC